ncbi:unnamed protein product [Closterium sp. NIES-54]
MAYIWTHTPSLQRSLRRSNSCGELASGHHEHLGVGRSEGERREGVEGGMEVGEQGNRGSWGGKMEVAEAAVAVAGGGRGWGRKGGMWGGFFSGQLGQTQGGFWGGDEQQQRRGGGEEEDSDDSDDFLPPGFSAPLVYSAYEVKTPYLPEPLEAAEAREAREAPEDREHGPVQASCVVGHHENPLEAGDSARLGTAIAVEASAAAAAAAAVAAASKASDSVGEGAEGAAVVAEDVALPAAYSGPSVKPSSGRIPSHGGVPTRQRSSANHSTVARGQGSNISNISSISNISNTGSTSSSSSSSSQPSFRPYGMPPQRAAGQHNGKPCSQPSRSDIQKPSCGDTQRPPPADMQRRLVSISDPRDLPFRVPVAASVTTLPSFAEYRAKLALENGAGGGVGRGGGVGASGEKGERMGEGVEGVERVVGRKRGKGRGMRREVRGECEKRNVGRGDKGNVEKQKGDKEKGGTENGDNGKGDLKKRDKDNVGERRRHLVRSFLLPETVSEHAEGECGAVEASAYDASGEQAEGASSGEERGNKLIAVEEGEGESSGVEACAYEASREQAEGTSSGEEEEGTTNGLQGCTTATFERVSASYRASPPAHPPLLPPLSPLPLPRSLRLSLPLPLPLPLPPPFPFPFPAKYGEPS